MKNKITLLLSLSLITLSALTGCGSTASNVSENAENSTEVAEVTEASTEATTEAHEHSYTETITVEATCTEDGESTYLCECGDTKTEVIKATGHIFETYTSNNDATYTTDGTETAKCKNCDATDTRTAENSMLAYTYTDMDKTMYAQQTVNVRSLPNTDGEKLGGLSQNDEIKITGQCNETSWYRFELNGQTAYVSNKYVGESKVEVAKAEAPAQSESTATAQSSSSGIEVNVCSNSKNYQGRQPSLGKCPYPLNTKIDNGDGTYTAYITCNHGGYFNGVYGDFPTSGASALKYELSGSTYVDALPYDEGCIHVTVGPLN